MLARSLALAAILCAGSTLAQAQTLPETSRSESAVSGINNSLARQSESRTIQQQNQFEVNSLRNARPVPTTPIVVPSPVAPATPMR